MNNVHCSKPQEHSPQGGKVYMHGRPGVVYICPSLMHEALKLYWQNKGERKRERIATSLWRCCKELNEARHLYAIHLYKACICYSGSCFLSYWCWVQVAWMSPAQLWEHLAHIYMLSSSFLSFMISVASWHLSASIVRCLGLKIGHSFILIGIANHELTRTSVTNWPFTPTIHDYTHSIYTC